MGLSAICAWIVFANTLRFSPFLIKACDLTVNAGTDADVCKPGSTVTLNATTTGIYSEIAWSPAAKISNPAALTTTAIVDSTTTFIVTIRGVDNQNLIVNGDFNQGDTGFTTDYRYGTGGRFGLLSNDTSYAIANNSGATHNRFANCRDNSGIGNMMVVNGSGTENNIWCQQISVLPNTGYSFSAFATSVNSENPGRLQFSINGVLLGSPFQLSSSTCNWQKFTATWNSSGASTALICVVNVLGTQAGNDFALDDLTFNQICESKDSITVRVLNLNAAWAGPTTLCQNQAAITLNSLLRPEATTGGTWTIDGGVATTLDPARLSPGNHLVRYTVATNGCNEILEQTIVIQNSASAGIPTATPRICGLTDTTILLETLLNNETAGGVWSIISGLPGGSPNFNAMAGSVNTRGLSPGVFTFQYFVDSGNACQDAEIEVSIIVDTSPIADAGPDQTQGCGAGEVILGGPSTSFGSQFTYRWTHAAGNGAFDVILNEPQKIIALVAGTFYLTVRNAQSGCSATDSVVVNDTKPQIELQAVSRPASCFGTDDGIIIINQASGGASPYTFALGQNSFSTAQQYNFLKAGLYDVLVKDANDCLDTTQVEVQQPDELDVIIGSKSGESPVNITFGDSIVLEAFINTSADRIDSIIWQPALPNCFNCTQSWVKPLNTTQFQVLVRDRNGCEAKSEFLVNVEKKSPVFVPNVFSPNNDGNNDVFYILAGNAVRIVKAFRVFNRWGTIVHEARDFLPNDPEYGWNGMYKGKTLNPEAFVFTAEIELIDGAIEVVSGEVALVK